jgi:hypothetical protein
MRNIQTGMPLQRHTQYCNLASTAVSAATWPVLGYCASGANECGLVAVREFRGWNLWVCGRDRLGAG